MPWQYPYKYVPGQGYVPVKTWVGPLPQPEAPKGNAAKARADARKRAVRAKAAAEAKAKREREAIAAERRKDAFEALKRVADQKRAQINASIKGRELAATSRIMLRENKITGVDAQGRQVSLATTSAAEALAKAEKTGNYEPVFQAIRDKQKKTGGRYIDKTAWKKAFASAEAQQIKANAIVKKWETRFTKLAESKNYRLMREFLDSDELARDDAFVKRIGKTSLATQRLTGEISQAQQDWLLKGSLGINAPGWGGNYQTEDGRDMSSEQEQYIAQITRGAKAAGVTTDVYQKMLDKRLADDYMRRFKDYQNQRIALEAQGYVIRTDRKPDPSDWTGFEMGGGDEVERVVDPREEAYFNSVRKLLWATGTNPDKIFHDLMYGNSIEQKRAFEAIRKAKVDESDLRFEGLKPTKSGLLQSPEEYAKASQWEIDKHEAKVQVEKDVYKFTRQEKPEGLEEFMSGVLRVPGASEVLTGMGVPVGTLFGGVRLLSNYINGGKRFYEQQSPWDDPFLRRHLTMWEQFGSVESKKKWDAAVAAWEEGQGRVGRDVKEMQGEARAMYDLLRVGGTGDLGQWFEAVANYGMSPTQDPLVNFGLTSLLDPLNLVAPLKWAGAGRAAIRRAGGIRAAISSPVDTARWANLYLSNKDALRTLMAKTNNEAKYGKGVTDKVMAELRLEELFNRGDKKLINEASRLARLTGVPEPDVRQILQSVTDQIEFEIIQRAASGIKGVSGDELAQRIRRARNTARRAELSISGQKGDIRAGEDLDVGRGVVGGRRRTALRGPLTTAGRKVKGAKFRESQARAKAVAEVKAYEAQHAGHVDMLDEAGFVKEYRDVRKRATDVANRKVPPRSQWTPEMERLWKAGDSEGFAKLVGYTKAELDDLRRVNEFTADMTAAELRAATTSDPQGDFIISTDLFRERLRLRTARLKARDRKIKSIVRPVKLAERDVARAEGGLAELKKRRGDVEGAKPTKDIRLQRSRLMRQLDEYEQVRKDVAEHTAVLADAHADDHARAQAYANLEAALRKADSFEDRLAADGVTTLPGRLKQARQDLDDARMDAGMRDLRGAARVQSQVPFHQIDNELAQIKQEMVIARQAGDTARVRELGASARFLNRERLRGQARAVAADRVVRRFRLQARAFVNRNRVVAKVRSALGAAEEGQRDLYGKYKGMVDSDEVSKALDAGERQALEGARIGMRQAGLDLSDPLLRRVEPQLRGRTLEDAFVILSHVSNDPLYRAAFSRIYRQVGKATGLDPGKVLASLRREHYARGVSMKMAADIDADIVARKKLRGGPARQGVLQSARVSTKAPDPTAGIATIRQRDSNLELIIDKYDSARDAGTTIFGYDQVHPLFKDSMLKENSSLALWRQAEAEAQATGRSFDEVYEELYEKRAQYEADAWLRREAYDMAGLGMSDEAIFAAFAKQNNQSELVVNGQPTKGVNDWQRRQMRDALIEGGMRDPDDLASVHAALGGELRLPDGAIRALTPEEFPGAKVGIPGWVVPDNHPKLQSPLGPHHVQGMHIGGDGVYISEKVMNSVAGPRVVMHEYAHALHVGDVDWRPSAGGAPSPQELVINGFLAKHFTPAQLGGAGRKSKVPIMRSVMHTTASTGEVEFWAQLYMIWAMGDRPSFAVNTAGQVRQGATWAELKALHPGRAKMFAEAEALFPTLQTPSQVRYGVRGFNRPPFTSQAATYKWLVDEGFWSKRTRDDIESGGDVWDIDTEREWFERRFGFSPPWTDPDVIREAMRTKESWDEFKRAGGYKDELFVSRSLGAGVQGAGLKDALSFGGMEAVGIQKQRTPQQVREWMAKRFGTVFSDDGGKTIKEAPWLMDPRKQEYADWVTRYVEDAIGQKGLSPTLAADLVRRRAKYVDAAGKKRTLLLPPGFVRPDQVHAYAEVLGDVVRRHMTDYLDKGGAPMLMPERQMRIAHDVLDQLLATKEWRSLADRPLAAEFLKAVGWIQRMTVMFSGAFAVVNPIERVAFRYPLSQIRYTDMSLAGHVDDDARAVISSRAALGIDSTGLMEARTRSGWSKFRDTRLEGNARGFGLLQAVGELPMQISGIGEEAMQLHFMRRIYMDFRDSFTRQGMDPELARVEAMHEARRRTIDLFALSDDATDFEKALNALFPFFSYNFRTAKLAAGIAASHPAVINLQSRLGHYVESVNRRKWDEEHPDNVPFPEDDPDMRKVHIKIGDSDYAVDLSQYSDVLRASDKLWGSKTTGTLPGWFGNIFRVPHPLQLGLWAWMTGNEAPWGDVGMGDFFWPEELSQALNSIGDGKEYADAIEMISTLFTWNKWKKMDPVQKGANVYYMLIGQGKFDEAEELLHLWPEVQHLVDSHSPKSRMSPSGELKVSYWRGRSHADQDQFAVDMQGYKDLQDHYDRLMKEYWDRPWDPARSALNKERKAVLALYELEHPDITGVFAHGMSRGEWIEKAHDIDIDALTDQFFDLSESLLPKEDARGKDGKLIYAKDDAGQLKFALDKRRYDRWKAAWLAANPLVEARITSASNDMMFNWREFEATKAARFSIINDLTIRRLKEQLKGDKADKDLIGDLYDISEYYWDLQNRDVFMGGAESGDLAGLGLGHGQMTLGGGLKEMVLFPGMERLKQMKMKPEELKVYLAKKKVDDAYHGVLDAVSAQVDASGKDGKEAGALWYKLLEQHPDEYRRYLREHPVIAERIRVGKAYFNAISPWGEAIGRDDWEAADRIWAALPAWVKDRYYATHPGSAERAREAQAYMAAMGKWIKLLGEKNYEAADKHFRSLPDWVKERYFKKHPDQRYTLGTDMAMQKKLGQYFLADDLNRVRYLKENPDLRRYLAQYDKADSHRALVMAMYQSLDDAWAKRAYREKYPEYFSQEAKAEDRRRSLVKKLKAHPELRELYDEAVKLQTFNFEQQLKQQGVRPPKPLDLVHLQRHVTTRKRIRRRAARFSSHWQQHEEARHG